MIIAGTDVAFESTSTTPEQSTEPVRVYKNGGSLTPQHTKINKKMNLKKFK